MVGRAQEGELKTYGLEGMRNGASCRIDKNYNSLNDTYDTILVDDG